MGTKINNDIFRLSNIDLHGMSRKAYAIHLELISGLEADHADLY